MRTASSVCQWFNPPVVAWRIEPSSMVGNMVDKLHEMFCYLFPGISVLCKANIEMSRSLPVIAGSTARTLETIYNVATQMLWYREGSAVFNFLKVRIVLIERLHLCNFLTMLSVAQRLYSSVTVIMVWLHGLGMEIGLMVAHIYVFDNHQSLNRSILPI